MNILYIEDNKALGEVTTELLTLEGHYVIWYTERPWTLDISRYDLVISDYEVPGSTFEVTKAQCDKEHLPLLLVSGTTFDEVPHNHYLRKPFELSTLLDSIKEVMK